VIRATQPKRERKRDMKGGFYWGLFLLARVLMYKTAVRADHQDQREERIVSGVVIKAEDKEGRRRIKVSPLLPRMKVSAYLFLSCPSTYSSVCSMAMFMHPSRDTKMPADAECDVCEEKGQRQKGETTREGKTTKDNGP